MCKQVQTHLGNVADRECSLFSLLAWSWLFSSTLLFMKSAKTLPLFIACLSLWNSPPFQDICLRPAFINCCSANYFSWLTPNVLGSFSLAFTQLLFHTSLNLCMPVNPLCSFLPVNVWLVWKLAFTKPRFAWQTHKISTISSQRKTSIISV